MSSLFPDTASQTSARNYRIPCFQTLAAVACFAIGVWGVRVCRTLIGPHTSGADSELNVFVSIASWFVLFGPFAVLGGYSLLRAVKRVQGVLPGRHDDGSEEVLPPASSNAMQSIQAGDLRGYRPGVDHAEPLDDATAHRLGEMATRTAKLVGCVVGLLFLGSGLTGFVLGWIYTHRPIEPYSSLHYELANFRLIGVFLVGCGLAVIFGGVILRETFAKPKTSWLIPLRAFTAIAGRRLVTEEQQERKKRGTN
jgi:hypothetical protein